jgi:cation diffusion facilitator CzcD-associated flavoprotein CzcO
MEMIGNFEVVIVGGGASGVGTAMVLRDLGITNYVILERQKIGATFDRWPKEMRFITPSFTSNSFGALDLNSISLHTSPAFTLGVEHPTGKQYAQYLRAVAEHYELPHWIGIDVQKVPRAGEGFVIETSHGMVRTRFVIWAAGEFQYPNQNGFAGANLCQHNSRIRSWEKLEGTDFTVIGGSESGIDAAVNLAAYGKSVTVLDTKPMWEAKSSDPSVMLSPFTHDRLRLAMNSGLVTLAENARIKAVEKNEYGYLVWGEDGRMWQSPTRPIAATGFQSSLTLVKDLFAFNEDATAKVTKEDESTLTPGLFLVGPQLRHDKVIFCFIYKFRQRFAIVAHTIAKRLQMNVTKELKPYKKAQMYLSDLSCCKDECAC